MKRIGLSAFAVLVSGLLYGGVAKAEGGGYPLEVRGSGRVESVDLSKGTITLSDREKVVVSKNAYITKDEDPAFLSDIKPGDELKASFTNGVPDGAARVEVKTSRKHLHEAN